ncbi:MAG: hypothetical protein AAGI91_03290 [Bacteroidota bacterium]
MPRTAALFVFLLALLNGCDSTTNSPPYPTNYYGSGIAQTSEGNPTVLSIPVIPGMSQANYVNLKPNYDYKPFSWSHPLGGIIISDWVGLQPPNASLSYTYEDMGFGPTPLDRLLNLGVRMGSPNDLLSSGIIDKVEVLSGSITLPVELDHWNGAILYDEEVNFVSINISQQSSFNRASAITHEYSPGSYDYFNVRGGGEPGVFMYIDTANLDPFRSNLANADNQCNEPSSQLKNYSHTFSLQKRNIPLGTPIKIGAYAQVGELALTSPNCDGKIDRTASVFDVEALSFSLFESSGSANLSVDGDTESPTTIPAGTVPNQVTVDLLAPNSSETISRIWVRASGDEIFSRAFPQINGTQAYLILSNWDTHYIIVSTSDGRVGRFVVELCGGTAVCENS